MYWKKKLYYPFQDNSFKGPQNFQKPATTVRIFDRNDYYSVHGADATTAAREVFSSVANIKKMGLEPNRLDYLVLSKGNFEILIKKILLVSPSLIPKNNKPSLLCIRMFSVKWLIDIKEHWTMCRTWYVQDKVNVILILST